MNVSVRTFKVIETFFRQNILKDFQISRCASVFSTLFWSTEHSLCQNSCQPKILFNLTKTFRFQSSQNSLYLCCCQLRGNCWKKKKTTLIQMALLSVCGLDILDWKVASSHTIQQLVLSCQLSCLGIGLTSDLLQICYSRPVPGPGIIAIKICVPLGGGEHCLHLYTLSHIFPCASYIS